MCRIKAVYRLEEHTLLHAPRGSVLFLPQGSSYQCTFYASPGEKAHCRLVEFALRSPRGESICVYDRVTVVGSDENPLVPELFRKYLYVSLAILILDATYHRRNSRRHQRPPCELDLLKLCTFQRY